MPPFVMEYATIKTSDNIKMKETFLAILSFLLLTNCNYSEENAVEKNDRIELIPEPDKAEREAYENQNKLTKSTCIFSLPDTSVAGIKIRNTESTLNILGKKIKLEGDSTHIFYSQDKKQKLGLTIHPGDHYNQISVFNISYTENSKQNFQQINTKEFVTEKGIKLGISKNEIIEKLGTCYISKDSAKNSIILNYTIEVPNDSKTKLLASNNMPIYYASYKLINNKLENIEFGFEYP